MDRAEHVELIRTRLRDAVLQSGLWMSWDDRIGESDVSRLLGWNVESFANLRRRGGAPRSYRVAGGGHQVTYYLIDVAHWFVDRAFDPSDPIEPD